MMKYKLALALSLIATPAHADTIRITDPGWSIHFDGRVLTVTTPDKLEPIPNASHIIMLPAAGVKTVTVVPDVTYDLVGWDGMTELRHPSGTLQVDHSQGSCRSVRTSDGARVLYAGWHPTCNMKSGQGVTLRLIAGKAQQVRMAVK